MKMAVPIFETQCDDVKFDVDDMCCIDSNENVLKPINFENNFENNFINKHDFKQRFLKYTCGLLDFMTDWSHVSFAGGGIINILNKDYDFNENSDIDLFLYGTRKEQCEKAKYIITHLKNISNNIEIFVKNFRNNMLEIRINNKIIQLIFGVYNGVRHDGPKYFTDPRDVLCHFDMDCCKVYYDGNNVFALDMSVLYCLKNRIMNVNEEEFRHCKWNNPHYDRGDNYQMFMTRCGRYYKYMKYKKFRYVYLSKNSVMPDYMKCCGRYGGEYDPKYDINNDDINNYLGYKFEHKYIKLDLNHINEYIDNNPLLDEKGFSYDIGYEPSDDVSNHILQYEELTN